MYGRYFFFIILAVGVGLAELFLQINKKAETSVLDPALMKWVQVTSTIPWSPRDSHALVVYNDKMWLMGGLNANGQAVKPGAVEYWKAPHFSDVWASGDGVSWNLVQDKAPWGNRRSVQTAVFNNKMWLIAGWGPQTGYTNDVWFSEDGVSWAAVTSTIAWPASNAKPARQPNGSHGGGHSLAGWPAREGHSLAVFNGKMWLIGGVNYDQRKVMNDVWYSENGVDWIEAISNAPWQPRWDHAVTIYKNKLWLIGGMDLKDNTFDDVWNSEDGENWVLVTDNPPWQSRQGHDILDFKGKLWLIGRLNDLSNGGANDVWYSENGVDWTKTKDDPAWLGREDSAAVIFKDKIWIMGGMDSNWRWRNDIWYSIFQNK